MVQEKRVVEARGESVEEAIELGLAELGVSRSDVIVDVIDEGSRGLFGLGSKEAIVSLTALTTGAPPVKPAPAVDESANENGLAPETAPMPVSPENIEAEDEEARATIVAMVEEMMQKMAVDVDVTSAFSELDDVTGRRVLVVNIDGENLSPLIGPRGEALNALQYVLRLMAGHKLQRRANFVVDVGGYRERREAALTRLAERMAQKVIRQRRPVTLESMSPYERRIIHMTLRDHSDVYTQSTGMGDRRRVRIYPR